MQVKVGTYKGTGVDNRVISDPGFKPGFIIVTNAASVAGDSYECVWRTADMSNTAYFDNSAHAANLIQAFETDGFQIGTGSSVNASGVEYYYVCATDTGTIDYETGTYSGTGTTSKVVTMSQSFTPTMIMLGASSNHSVAWDGTTEKAALMYTIGALGYQSVDSVGSGTFTVGDTDFTNKSGVTYYYVAIKNTTISHNSGYTGDGNDDRVIGGHSFQPDMILVNSLSL